MRRMLPTIVPPLLLLSACANTAQAPVEGGAAAVSVVMDRQGFAPSDISIGIGQSVCWINREASDGRWPASNIHPTHDIYPAFDPKKPIPPGETWCFTFDQEGIWRFHDHLFPEFTGVVRVTDGAGAE